MRLVAGMLCLHGLSLFHPEVNVLVTEQLLEKKRLTPSCGLSPSLSAHNTHWYHNAPGLLQMTVPTVMTLTRSQS